jgi:hypothetical protein
MMARRAIDRDIGRALLGIGVKRSMLVEPQSQTLMSDGETFGMGIGRYPSGPPGVRSYAHHDAACRSRLPFRAMISRCCGSPRCLELCIAPATALAPFGPGFVLVAPRSRRFTQGVTVPLP